MYTWWIPVAKKKKKEKPCPILSHRLIRESNNTGCTRALFLCKQLRIYQPTTAHSVSPALICYFFKDLRVTHPAILPFPYYVDVLLPVWKESVEAGESETSQNPVQPVKIFSVPIARNGFPFWLNNFHIQLQKIRENRAKYEKIKRKDSFHESINKCTYFLFIQNA